MLALALDRSREAIPIQVAGQTGHHANTDMATGLTDLSLDPRGLHLHGDAVRTPVLPAYAAQDVHQSNASLNSNPLISLPPPISPEKTQLRGRREV